ncbi:MAG: radical SAM protein [Clostridia bacterium]|nr:radical SAM protein [Clostridia bacterium]
MEIKLDLSQELKNFANKDNQYTIPIFIPHKGCPNNCVFCNQKKISGQIEDVTIEDVDNKIKEYLEYYKDSSKKIEIAFFGGSFTGIDIELQISYLEVANKYIKEGRVDSIRISTRPDYINEDILAMLKKYNVKTIELGVQSMDEKVLEVSQRGHTSQDVITASNLIRKYGIRLGHQIMIGLPESTIETELYTIRECLKLEPKQLRIYPVYVIEDSELYAMYKNSVYKPLSISEAVSRCSKVIKECTKTDVAIIRLGLQSTEDITIANTNIYGPVSDNLAEYVMAEIVRNKIEKILDNNLINDDIIIYVQKRYVSICVGPKKINKIYFEQKYNVKYIVKGEI